MYIKINVSMLVRNVRKLQGPVSLSSVLNSRSKTKSHRDITIIKCDCRIDYLFTVMWNVSSGPLHAASPKHTFNIRCNYMNGLQAVLMIAAEKLDVVGIMNCFLKSGLSSRRNLNSIVTAFLMAHGSEPCLMLHFFSFLMNKILKYILNKLQNSIILCINQTQN